MAAVRPPTDRAGRRDPRRHCRRPSTDPRSSKTPGIDVVAEAADEARALQVVRNTQPDAALMDIRMPVIDGIEATRRISTSGVPCRVLILTTFDFDRLVYDAMLAGASAFLLKDAGREQLIAGVRIVAAGEQLVAPPIARRRIERYVRRPPSAIVRPHALTELSAREPEALRSSPAICPTPNRQALDHQRSNRQNPRLARLCKDRKG